VRVEVRVAPGLLFLCLPPAHILRCAGSPGRVLDKGQAPVVGRTTGAIQRRKVLLYSITSVLSYRFHRRKRESRAIFRGLGQACRGGKGQAPVVGRTTGAIHRRKVLLYSITSVLSYRFRPRSRVLKSFWAEFRNKIGAGFANPAPPRIRRLATPEWR
jgi:hypothetical protein